MRSDDAALRAGADIIREALERELRAAETLTRGMADPVADKYLERARVALAALDALVASLTAARQERDWAIRFHADENRDRRDAEAALAAARQREQQLTQALERVLNAWEASPAVPTFEEAKAHWLATQPVRVSARAVLAGEAPPTPESGSAKNAESAPDGDLICRCKYGAAGSHEPGCFNFGSEETGAEPTDDGNFASFRPESVSSDSSQLWRDPEWPEGVYWGDAEVRPVYAERSDEVASTAPGVPGSPTAPRPEAPEEKTGAPDGGTRP